MTKMISIPSVNRVEKCIRVIEGIESKNRNGIPVAVFVEPSQYREYLKRLPRSVEVIKHELPWRGMSYTYWHMSMVAAERGVRRLIMWDDDVLTNDDYNLLFKEMDRLWRKDKVASLGCFFPILDLYTNKGEGNGCRNDGPVIIGSDATQIWLVDIPAVMEVGGFDTNYAVYSDKDLQIRMLLGGYKTGACRSVTGKRLNMAHEDGGWVSLPIDIQSCKNTSYLVTLLKYGEGCARWGYRMKSEGMTWNSRKILSDWEGRLPELLVKYNGDPSIRKECTRIWKQYMKVKK